MSTDPIIPKTASSRIVTDDDDKVWLYWLINCAATSRFTAGMRQTGHGGPRMRPKLRLYIGDEEGYEPEADRRVPMKFGELLTVISDACRFRRTWLNDFEDDDVEVPEDLYEVISAYWSLKPGA